MVIMRRTRPVLLFSRVMQWISAVVVMGLASNFINKFSVGEHIIYDEVIATTTVVFFLLPLATALSKRFHWHWIVLDLIYSYLWLTAAVFASQDYSWQDCSATDPVDETSCTKKHALEAFIFLAFFFTVMSLVIQTLVWTHERPITDTHTHTNTNIEKNGATNA